MKTVVLEPNYEGTIRWCIDAFAGHHFITGRLTPIASFMEQVRYLHQTEPDKLQRIIEETYARAKARGE